jgi:hypothetical protein
MARPQRLMDRLFRKRSALYPAQGFWARFDAIHSPRWMELLWFALTLVGVVHLGAVLLVPGGTNQIFGWKARSVFAYQTYFPAPDVLGFPPVVQREGFLLYKIYGQDGQMLDGSFPDPLVRPRIRYDRWAAAGNLATANLPDLHSSIMAYLVNQLPEPPLRIEMYSARWVWDRNKFQFPWRGFNKDSALDLKPLGSYNGLTKVWTPAEGAQ